MVILVVDNSLKSKQQISEPRGVLCQVWPISLRETCISEPPISLYLVNTLYKFISDKSIVLYIFISIYPLPVIRRPVWLQLICYFISTLFWCQYDRDRTSRLFRQCVPLLYLKINLEQFLGLIFPLEKFKCSGKNYPFGQFGVQETQCM